MADSFEKGDPVAVLKGKHRGRQGQLVDRGDYLHSWYLVQFSDPRGGTDRVPRSYLVKLAT